MRRLLFNVKIAGFYFLQALKMRMEYRADFLMECLASLLQQATGLLTLTFLFNSFQSMKGWTREEVFFIYGFSLLPMALFAVGLCWLTARIGAWAFSELAGLCAGLVLSTSIGLFLFTSETEA